MKKFIRISILSFGIGLFCIPVQSFAAEHNTTEQTTVLKKKRKKNKRNKRKRNKKGFKLFKKTTAVVQNTKPIICILSLSKVHLLQ